MFRAFADDVASGSRLIPNRELEPEREAAVAKIRRT